MPDQWEYINNYFNGSLSPEEVLLFEKKIAEDPSFAEAVAFYVKATEAARSELAEERKERFRQLPISTQPGKEKTIVRMLKPFMAAAVLILALFIGWNYFSSKSVSTLADHYIKDSLSTFLPTMGAGTDSIESGIRLLNEQKLDEAAALFGNILMKDSSNAEVLNLQGITLLKKGDFTHSIACFKKLQNIPGLFINKGAFHHALALLQRNGKNDKEEARTLLELVVREDLYGKQTAQEWLKKW